LATHSIRRDREIDAIDRITGGRFVLEDFDACRDDRGLDRGDPGVKIGGRSAA